MGSTTNISDGGTVGVQAGDDNDGSVTNVCRSGIVGIQGGNVGGGNVVIVDGEVVDIESGR